MSVLVFKTSIYRKSDIKRIRPLLEKEIKMKGKWNFDLQDCDKILRIEGEGIEAYKVISLLSSAGFACEELV
jgi:hypothetical protein